jgi:hypothetical protein
MDQWTPVSGAPLSTHGIAFRRRLNFHRIGVGIAPIVIAVGAALVGAAVIRLDLFELLRVDTFSIVLGSTLAFIGVIAIGAYGVVRTVERFTR